MRHHVFVGVCCVFICPYRSKVILKCFWPSTNLNRVSWYASNDWDLIIIVCVGTPGNGAVSRRGSLDPRSLDEQRRSDQADSQRGRQKRSNQKSQSRMCRRRMFRRQKFFKVRGDEPRTKTSRHLTSLSKGSHSDMDSVHRDPRLPLTKPHVVTD